MIVKKILTFKNELDFSSNINYDCNIILSDNKLIRKMNNKFRNIKHATDVLTFVSKLKNHKVNKIITGKRHTLAIWMSGPKFR